MAYTITHNKTVFGNKRVNVMKVVADAATQNVETGLGYIDGYTMGPQSIATANPSIIANLGAGATALNGTLGMSGLASGDEMFITVYGR